MYDRSAIANDLKNRFLGDPRFYMTLSDEADGEQEALEQSYDFRYKEFFEVLAAQFHLNLEAAFPGASTFGDTYDLIVDRVFAAGSCDLPPRNTPIQEAFVQITVDRKWGPLWVFFLPDRIQLCKSSEYIQKGIIFPAVPFGEVEYADPRVFLILKRVLDHLGFPIPVL